MRTSWVCITFSIFRRLYSMDLCTKVQLRKLLWWSVIVGVPQFIPMAFVHSGRQALLMAVLIGLMGGLANAACIDIAIRACPPGLQGTLMMMVAATFPLSSRGGDVVGSWGACLVEARSFGNGPVTAPRRDILTQIRSRLPRLSFSTFGISQLSLKIEHDPCWCMVAGVCLSTRPSVYATVHQPARHLRREQKVIQSHAFVLRPPFKFVIPECPERPIRM